MTRVLNDLITINIISRQKQNFINSRWKGYRYIRIDPSTNNCFNILNNNENYTAIWTLIPYGIKIKTVIVKELFNKFRERFENNPRLSKHINSNTLRIGYSLSQTVAKIISAMNKRKLDRFYRNNHTQPRVIALIGFCVKLKKIIVYLLKFGNSKWEYG